MYSGSRTIRNTSPRHERGQVLVIVALAMVTIIAMVGVVIDGGYAWGKQRETQNASDAMAKAGAGVLADNLAGVSPQNDDTDVWNAMNEVARVNDVGFPASHFTNFQGQLLTISGGLATGTGDAPQVGDGASPPGTMGVKAVSNQTFDTFMARIIGFNQFTTTTDATARTGWPTASCDADAGCIVMPIIIPVTVLGCDGQNKPGTDRGCSREQGPVDCAERLAAYGSALRSFPRQRRLARLDAEPADTRVLRYR